MSRLKLKNFGITYWKDIVHRDESLITVCSSRGGITYFSSAQSIVTNASSYISRTYRKDRHISIRIAHLTIEQRQNSYATITKNDLANDIVIDLLKKFIQKYNRKLKKNAA
jgi:hypothetical protein